MTPNGIGTYTFTYNTYDNGNETKLTDPAGNQTVWQYNGLGQTTVETNAPLVQFRPFLVSAERHIGRHIV